MNAGPHGVVFDIQRYAVHDGPGIRTLVFLKGCPLRCAWCCNPESWHPGAELRHTRARCRTCGGCVAACPARAIVVSDGRLSIDRTACSACVGRACAAACPEAALRTVGTEMRSSEVLAAVARDMPFYRHSGGGVTFSGGEPFAQPEFLLALLAGCRERGISTAVETCGWAEMGDLDAALPLVDLFLFDLKLVDPERHRAATGRDNTRIVASLARLAAVDPDRVMLRFPLVPGWTDDDANVAAVAALARRCGVASVDLEPYHPLGRPKRADLGLPEAVDPRVPGRTDIERALATFAAHGLRAVLA